MMNPGIRVALWGATAVVVTVSASLAIAATVGGRGAALSRDDVARELAAGPPDPPGTPTGRARAPAGPAVPVASATPGGARGVIAGATGAGAEAAEGAEVAAPGPGASPGDQVGTAVSGSVVISCDGDVARLVSWSPNPGYWAEQPVRGPAAVVSVRFDSDVAPDMLVTATCVDGHATITEQAAQGGGGADGGGTGDGGTDGGGGSGGDGGTGSGGSGDSGHG